MMYIFVVGIHVSPMHIEFLFSWDSLVIDRSVCYCGCNLLD